MSRLAAVFLLLLLGVNCSPAVQSTALGTAHPPRAPNAEVLTYSVRTPECAFEEIALVTVEQQPSVYFIGVEKPLAAMEKRARRLGGDAISA